MAEVPAGPQVNELEQGFMMDPWNLERGGAPAARPLFLILYQIQLSELALLQGKRDAILYFSCQ